MSVYTDMAAAWPDDVQEEFEERAAIMEYDGEMTRLAAERAAVRDVLSRHPGLK